LYIGTPPSRSQAAAPHVLSTAVPTDHTAQRTGTPPPPPPSAVNLIDYVSARRR